MDDLPLQGNRSTPRIQGLNVYFIDENSIMNARLAAIDDLDKSMQDVNPEWRGELGMLDNYRLIVLAGGFTRCDSAWNKPIAEIERCYKVYVPVDGTASIETDTGVFPLAPGQIYFISGFHLKAQRCPTRMDVHWLHFMPESMYLSYLLDQVSPVQQWPRGEEGWSLDACEEISRMFPAAAERLYLPREDVSPATACRIQGLLLSTVARLLRTLDAATLESFHPRYLQLKPALDFMQAHYQDNPSLKVIASQVHLAPTYFHRQFTALFDITPFNYMMNQRLNKARHLLAGTSLSIKEIAEAVGYDNPLYFSRVFAAQMGIAPSSYRALNAEAAPAPRVAGAGRVRR